MAEQDINSVRTDDLSPKAIEVLRVNLAGSYTQLVVKGDGNADARRLLENLAAADLWTAPIKNRESASAVMAGLWLWHDWLDQSHRIAQSLPGADGSFWHAIMHRREGDFSNSKYWYNRCGDHPVFKVLEQQAKPVVHPLPADTALLRVVANGWNPAAFVDLVQQVHDDPNDPRHAAAVSLQQIEWRWLFDHCARHATGG